jgi:uncharacterized delta-60 repeat protein
MFNTRHPSARVRHFAVAATLLTASAITWVLAAPGSLDPGFGTGGVVLANVNPPNGCCEDLQAVAVQPDGKIIVAGGVTVSDPLAPFIDDDVLLARFNIDGSLDPAFGNGGVVIQSIGAQTRDRAVAMALQSDGKIVVTGSSWAGAGTTTQAAAMRFLADGTLDPAFGAGGKTTFGFSANDNAVTSLALQPDGRILVAGYTFDARGVSDFALARLSANGSIDGTFGNAGKVVTPVSSAPMDQFRDYDYANAVAVLPDGGIVVGGQADAVDGFNNSVTHMAVVRYTANGTLDANFGANGIKVFNFGVNYGYADVIRALAAQPDGKIVGGGVARNTNGGLQNEFAIVRLNGDGSFDPSFGGTGRVTTRLAATATSGTADASGSGMAIQPDGRIVVVGTLGNDYALARYQSGGALDTSFGSGAGVVATNLGGYDSARAIAVQADGKLVVAGNWLPLTGGGANAQILVARYDGGGGSTLQTIAFAPLPDRNLGDPPFTVSASASSNLPVRFTAAGVCSVVGVTVTLTGAGTCSITASQDGDNVFAPSPDVTQAFQVVGPRTLTITRTGSGTGRVESSPFGIDCGVNCVATFQDGALVTLTGQADSGSAFVGWSGDADCSDGLVTMTSNVSCVATFTSLRFVARLVAEIRPGTTGSAPVDMKVFNGALYFRANDGINGDELWRLDANTTTPIMVADIFPGPSSSSPSQLTVAGNVLYFGATSASGFELWQYDGISVTLAADINPGPGNSQLTSLTALGNQVVFKAYDGTDGEELFAFDPIAGLIKFNIDDSCPDCGSNPYNLKVHDGRLYFGAAEPVFGAELYSYDGATVTRLTAGSLSPGQFTVIGGRIIYAAGSFQTQLRSYEIATETDVEIVLPSVGFLGPAPGQFTQMNGVVYFTAQDDDHGRELWVTDGTQGGTRLVADVYPGPTGSNPAHLTPFNGELVFSATDQAAGHELRATTGVGSRLIADLAPGSNGSGFDGFLPTSSGLFFVSQGGGTTLHPWVTDGTAAGTEVIRKADGQLINPTGDSMDDTKFTSFNGDIYFAGSSSGNNFELWRIVLGGGGSQPPVAVATAPPTVQAAANCQADVLFDGTASSDPDGDSLGYVWSENGNVLATVAKPTITLGVGTHVIRLTVTDPQGATAFDEVVVTVNSSFTLTYLGPNRLQAEAPSALQVALADGGTPVPNAAILVTVNGVPSQATTDTNGVAQVAVAAQPGTSATVQLDYTAPCGVVTTSVVVPVNRWPTINPTAPSPVFAGPACTASVALSSNANDEDGDPLTYQWSDGGTALSSQPNPTVPLAPGQHTINLVVDDGNGGTRSGSVSVEV